MDNVKNDHYYAEKIRFDLNYIAVHMNGITRERFDEEEILQDAMMFRLIQISENAKKLTDEFKGQIDIPWIEVYGLRNRIVHEYAFSVQWDGRDLKPPCFTWFPAEQNCSLVAS